MFGKLWSFVVEDCLWLFKFLLMMWGASTTDLLQWFLELVKFIIIGILHALSMNKPTLFINEVILLEKFRFFSFITYLTLLIHFRAKIGGLQSLLLWVQDAGEHLSPVFYSVDDFL